jgi:formyltetrahydrofolate synthetase
LVKGNLTDKTLIIRRISEAISSLININIKVDIFDKELPLKFSLEDIRREYYNLLRECEEQSKKWPDHASQIYDIKLKVQENLEKALDYIYREFKVILSKEANS